jgi:DNA-binding CsgD family transcriptional regulator
MELELGWRDPATRLDLHRRAALLWRARGDLMSAYHHLSAIGEQSKANDLLVSPALDLVDHGDLDALHQFARRLPTQHHVANANLALDLAVVSLFADGTMAARRWHERAVALLDAAPVDEGAADDVRRRLHGLRSWLALLDADLDGALASIDAHGRLASGSTGEFERRFPIVAARVMLAARRRSDAEVWVTLAERLEGPPIIAEVTVPTLRAWYEWMYGDLVRAVALSESALGWMVEHHIGAHHLAFDTLITGAWCRLSVGDLPKATALAERAWADADTLGCAWNQLQAGYLGARLSLVTGDPARCLHLVDELREIIPFDVCRPYADRLVGVEVEALAAVGRTDEATGAIEALGLGPQARLLRARFQGLPDGEVGDLLASRATWPALERIQAELVLDARRNGSTPSRELVELVSGCGSSGWVLPFLGLGPRIERLLRSTQLARVHPRLARTLEYLAPADPIADPDRAGVRLTSRELSLVELLPTHLSYAEIGARLYLSVNTVKSNLKSVYRKLDATTRAEAVDASRRAGLI